MTLLDTACPFCSRLRADHRDLLEDVLCFPSIVVSAPSSERRYRNGSARVIGCPHVRHVFGPHENENAAKIALAQQLAHLRTLKAAEQERLNFTLARKLNETHEGHQGQVSGGTAGPPSTVAPALPLQEPGEAELVRQSVADRPSAEPGGSTGAVACVVGGTTWMNHDWDYRGQCKRKCGAVLPPLLGKACITS